MPDEEPEPPQARPQYEGLFLEPDLPPPDDETE